MLRAWNTMLCIYLLVQGIRHALQHAWKCFVHIKIAIILLDFDFRRRHHCCLQISTQRNQISPHSNKNPSKQQEESAAWTWCQGMRRTHTVIKSDRFCEFSSSVRILFFWFKSTSVPSNGEKPQKSRINANVHVNNTKLSFSVNGTVRITKTDFYYCVRLNVKD